MWFCNMLFNLGENSLYKYLIITFPYNPTQKKKHKSFHFVVIQFYKKKKVISASEEQTYKQTKYGNQTENVTEFLILTTS